MILTNRQKQELAQAIVNSRELCGDERAAIKQYCDDFGLPFPNAQIGSIYKIADDMWLQYQREAKVPAKYWI